MQSSIILDIFSKMATKDRSPIEVEKSAKLAKLVKLAAVVEANQADRDYQFLLTTLPFLGKMNDRENMSVRMKVMKVLR